jgi:hypothetical protein
MTLHYIFYYDTILADSGTNVFSVTVVDPTVHNFETESFGGLHWLLSKKTGNFSLELSSFCVVLAQLTIILQK